MDANSGRKSPFVSYCVDFRNHLTEHKKCRETYLELFEYWSPIREETIQVLEKLKENADKQNNTYRKVTIGTKAISIAGNAAFIAGCAVNPAVAAAGKAVATASSGAAAGVSAASSSKVNAIRKEVSNILKDDLVERKALISLGLEYNEIVEKIEQTILNLKGMSLSELAEDTYSGLSNMVGLKDFIYRLQRHNWRRGNIPRDIVLLLIEFFQDNTRLEGAAEIARTFRKFVNENPEAFDAAQNCIKMTFDIYCLKQLAEEHQCVANIFGSGAVSYTINGIIMFKDCYDIARIWSEGIITQSVTGEEIKDILVYLKREYDLLKKNYNVLKCFND